MAMEIERQEQSQEGRLNTVLQILEILKMETDSCERVIPMSRIAWFAKKLITYGQYHFRVYEQRDR